MNRSDQLLQKAFQGGLSKSDRHELREAYQYEQTKTIDARSFSRETKSKEDMLNLPRHRMYDKCSSFEECKICFKCRNFDASHMKCVNCELNQENLLCNKQLHTEKVLAMMIQRPRVEIEANE